MMDVPTGQSYSEPRSNDYEKQRVEYEPVTSITKETEPDPFRRKRYAKQVLLVTGACVGYAPVGMAIAWPNVLASDIINDNSTIFNTELHMNDWQMDMVASMMFVGSMPGFLLAGWLVGRIGRKWSMLAAGIPSIVGTTLIALTYNVYMLLIGRFLDGMAFGMMGVAVRAYVVEVSDLKVRGGACIMVNLLMQVGSISMLSIGIVVSWYYVSMFSTSIMLLFCLVIVPFLPESPAYLAVKNRDPEALAVLLRLRGPYADLDDELVQLKKMNECDDKKKLGFRGLWTPRILKRLTIMFGLFLIVNFSGVQVLKSNTVRILESSGFTLDKTVSTILITSILFMGNFTMMLLVDKIGRRWCLIISLTVLALAYFTLGSYNFIMEFYSSEPAVAISKLPYGGSNTTVAYESDLITGSNIGWTWVPLVSLMVAAFGQSFGAGPLPNVLAPEYFPTNMRSQGMSLCTMMGGLQSFAALQLFSPMQNFLTNGGLYWAYGLTATIGVPYTIFLIQETSGKRVG